MHTLPSINGQRGGIAICSYLFLSCGDVDNCASSVEENALIYLRSSSVHSIQTQSKFEMKHA